MHGNGGDNDDDSDSDSDENSANWAAQRKDLLGDSEKPPPTEIVVPSNDEESKKVSLTEISKYIVMLILLEI